VNEYGLRFTPGESMEMNEGGYFRFVFTAVDDGDFDTAMGRFEDFLRSEKQ